MSMERATLHISVNSIRCKKRVLKRHKNCDNFNYKQHGSFLFLFVAATQHKKKQRINASTRNAHRTCSYVHTSCPKREYTSRGMKNRGTGDGMEPLRYFAKNASPMKVEVYT